MEEHPLVVLLVLKLSKRDLYSLYLYLNHCCLNPSISLYVLLDKANTLTLIQAVRAHESERVSWASQLSLQTLVWTEVECKVHVVLTKIQMAHKLVETSSAKKTTRTMSLLSYCIYCAY